MQVIPSSTCCTSDAMTFGPKTFDQTTFWQTPFEKIQTSMGGVIFLANDLKNDI
jgi:hypothetical protein